MVSVIINVYNGERYIKKCLDSIVNQTYKDLEIIIINDGSTDNTLAICEEYKDNRIKIINQENRGIILSKKVGIENSTGDYIFFIDQDDFIELDTIEYLYNLCKDNNVKIATCRELDIYNYNFIVKKCKEKVEIISNKEMLKKILFWENRTETLWNKLIKKELLVNIRFENKPIDDLPFGYKIILSTDKIAYSNQVKYYYLKHLESTSMQRKENLTYSIGLYNIMLERYYYIKNIYPKFKENEIGVLYVIARLYLTNNREILDFLNKQGAREIYNKFFSLDVLTSSMKCREKIKLILFRINPNLHSFIINEYLKIKRKIK